mmetsp:Transcript_13366/g.29037  ORF Transcript_13366/g.29037 Transcript_13366/m.29037 type:complete len:209 (+) Transcript_13366:160-786(+)|eukprot:CAMPEP_0172312686 /NCGR_PEP_ID=MMETSP1058-20130122/18373_1 /TAXON_ID=83371 /ORGANISM="Detonula confervacea, Strain CCMP 353" /LENGTH=208 /DNA_ID=CAMNT_0013026223 /DNA_START=65 /DNA_END=691 /DNA_ORIENTATION=+
MAKKTLESEPRVDSHDTRVNGGRGSRLCMKLKAIPLWYVFLLSLFTVSEGNNGGRGSILWNSLPSFMSSNNNCFSKGTNACNGELSIVTPSSQCTGSIPATYSTTLFDTRSSLSTLRGGALNPFPSGYNPFGYSLTDLGKTYLEFDGSLDSDVGRFLSILKGGHRKTAAVMKEQWLEIVRVSKKGQSMRIYRKLDDMIVFCLKAGFID